MLFFTCSKKSYKNFIKKLDIFIKILYTNIVIRKYLIQKKEGIKMKKEIEKKINIEKEYRKEAIDRLISLQEEVRKLQEQINNEKGTIKLYDSIIEELEDRANKEYVVLSKNQNRGNIYYLGFDNITSAKNFARSSRKQAMPWVEIEIYQNGKLIYQVVSEAFETKFIKVD